MRNLERQDQGSGSSTSNTFTELNMSTSEGSVQGGSTENAVKFQANDSLIVRLGKGRKAFIWNGKDCSHIRDFGVWENYHELRFNHGRSQSFGYTR